MIRGERNRDVLTVEVRGQRLRLLRIAGPLSVSLLSGSTNGPGWCWRTRARLPVSAGGFTPTHKGSMARGQCA